MSELLDSWGLDRKNNGILSQVVFQWTEMTLNLEVFDNYQILSASNPTLGCKDVDLFQSLHEASVCL